MGKSGKKVEFQVEKKMRLDQILLLPLDMEGEEEEEKLGKRQKKSQISVKQAAIKVYGNNWKQSAISKI